MVFWFSPSIIPVNLEILRHAPLEIKLQNSPFSQNLQNVGVALVFSIILALAQLWNSVVSHANNLAHHTL
jgi:hypothetical protein